MRTVQFTLRQDLAAHGLRAYRLARGRVSERTVCALVRGEASRVDLHVADCLVHDPSGHEQDGPRPAVLMELPTRAGRPRFPVLAACG